MKINPKKLKRNAVVGEKLDFVPISGALISLFGIGIFYAVFRAGFNLAGFAVFFFGATFVICMALYGIGELNRRSAEKTVFNYADEVVRGAAEEVCADENIEVKINVSLTKDALVCTLSGGTRDVMCDLTPAKSLVVSSTLFIDVCLGVIGEKIRDNIGGGKAYENVFYDIIINGETTTTLNFVLNGTPNETELDRVKKIYDKRIKKYQKKKQ